MAGIQMHYAKRKKPNSKGHLSCESHLYEFIEKAKLYGQKTDQY